jgi:pimeloyl-ACP methyl ester carboxylesterase
MKKPIPAPTPDVVLPPNSNHEYFADCDSHPFKFDATAFELVNAWWLAEVSLIAYADSVFVTPRFSSAGLELAGQQPFSGSSTQCYVAHNDNFVIVAFRGTQVPRLGEDQDPLECLKNSVSDIYADAKFALVGAGQGYFVHRGFQKALEEVWADVSKHLDELRAEKPDRKFWFTGHSLGAALATLAADRHEHVNGLYTFGSPRVGNRKFSEQFRPGTYRFVNNNDIVTRVPPFGPFRPPRILPGIYKHVGQLVYIDRNHDIAAQTGTWTRFYHGMRRSIPGAFTAMRESGRKSIIQAPADFLTDHTPLYYALHIWNNYAAAQ